MYKSLARGKTKVAVDGGVRFFINSKTKPDLVIGDFDSTSLSPAQISRKYPKAELIEYPTHKDRTDSQLALETVIDRGAKIIDIIQPSLGELDHLLGNLMLLELVNRKNRSESKRGLVEARLLGRNYEARLIEDQSIKITDRIGHRLSIIPLSKRARLSCSGVSYPVSGLTIRRGESRSLRNLVTNKTAEVTVRGTGFLILLKP